ncbi:PAAR domain-containing protein [Novosphingobium sp.]|uniref:PAAR domain-containing protein n=1 Tax=Novosphingobium sp. TaxID=1874826 RepID=UPI003B522B36
MPPAARLTDMHACPMITGVAPHVGGPILPPCEATVLTGGLPQARVGDMLTCVGPPDVIAMGSLTVLVGGQPAARMGDLTAHGGSIILGLPTVMIGDAGSGTVAATSFAEAQASMGPVGIEGPAGDQAETAKAMIAAGWKGMAFCEQCQKFVAANG